MTNCRTGLWRASTHLAKNPKYRQLLEEDEEIRTFVEVKLNRSLSAQVKWDLIKKKAKQEIVDIQLLQAGKRWLENSEKSPGYIKRTIQQRLDQRTITNLNHPRTGQCCLDTTSKLNAAERFYQKLYTDERINPVYIY
ncbi:hypothetical protein G6F42_025523 [Rhizopus arrhizus]|nr:hypothetical protein G6F42_025523 [Rhizopus arrhizus]